MGARDAGVSKALLGIEEIRELLPHRYPILLVDRILEMDDGSVLAEKLISVNEPVLQGHFPGRPIFPGVLILEALGQTACVWAKRMRGGFEGLEPVLVGIDSARFRRPVVPGDVLQLVVRVLRQRGSMFRFEGVAKVEGELAAETTLLAAFVRLEESGG